jgi:hypothetical protein
MILRMKFLSGMNMHRGGLFQSNALYGSMFNMVVLLKSFSALARPLLAMGSIKPISSKQVRNFFFSRPIKS